METIPFSSNGVGREARLKFSVGCLVLEMREAKDGFGERLSGRVPMPKLSVRVSLALS